MYNVKINADIKKGRIDKNIYGHFAEHLGRCIYGGIYVGDDSDIPNVDGMRLDVVEALKKVKIPVLRWPGGCFADEYHLMDGIGEKSLRPSMVNTHWGNVTENNSFGTHEFFKLCEILGCEPYICGNVGSGSVQEMSQWIEYMTFGGKSPMSDLRRENGQENSWPLKYFGVGNESWGCGGCMRPEYYADLYRRYQKYCRNYDDNILYKIACGPSDDDYRWTEVLMREAGNYMDALALHYYTIPSGNFEDKSPATGFNEKEWFTTLKQTLYMEELISRHSAIMDVYDKEKKVKLIVDEWGVWYEAEPGTNPKFLYQQNTLRDALIAALNFHIFHNHNERVTMANIAQTVNVLQALVLTDGEKMIKTPTYHIFEMYTKYHDSDLLDISYDPGEYIMEGSKLPHISVSASKKDGQVFLSLVNLSHKDSAAVCIEMRGEDYSFIEGRILTSDTIDCHNTFEKPEAIAPDVFDKIILQQGKYIVKAPSSSVAVLTFG